LEPNALRVLHIQAFLHSERVIHGNF